MSDKCKGCGATIEYSAGVQSLKCPYCDAVNEIKKAEDALPDNVDFIIPLSVTVDDLEKQAYGYMASGDFTPDDMLESSTFIQRECFYVPAYLFKIDYQATWTASFGFDRKEPYTAYRTVTRNNSSHQEAYTAYRTVTDWQPSNGVDIGIFTVSTYAGSKLIESDLGVNSLVPSTIINGTPTGFNDSFMKGVEAESFATPEISAFSSVSDEINENIDARVKTHGQGDHQKDWHWNAQMSHETSTLYVPICHAVFDYQGTNYHFWIGGISNGEIRANTLPEDKNRKNLVNIGYIPAVIAGIGFIAACYFWGFSWIGAIVAAVAGGYAVTRRQAIVGYSKNIRESLLTQIQASASSMRDLRKDEQDKIARAFQRPEKPLLAKTSQDKVVLPAISLAALLGASIPAYLESPEYAASRELWGTEQAMVDVQVPVSLPKIQEPVVVPPPTAAPNNESQDNVNQPEESVQRPVEQNLVASLSQSQPVQAVDDLLVRSANCVDIKACIAIMLEAAYPRSPEAISIAATRIGELNQAKRGDRVGARKLNDMGLAEFTKKNYESAVTLLKQASVADPADVEVLSNLGYVALQANQINDAVSALTDSLLLDPRRTSTWVPIAELYTIRGKNENAVRALLLGYEFSSNKEKTIIVYETQSATAERESMRPIYAEALKNISAIRGN